MVVSAHSSTFAVCAAPAKRELLCCGKALFFKICFDFQLSARIYRLPPAKINLVQTASLMLKAGGENSHWGWLIFPLDKTEGVNVKHGIYSRVPLTALCEKIYNCVFLLLSATSKQCTSAVREMHGCVWKTQNDECLNFIRERETRTMRPVHRRRSVNRG
jgi:hypothetical protein